MQMLKLITTAHSFPLHCPFTGQLITRPEGYTPSPATVMIFCEDAGTHEYLAPELQEAYDEAVALYE